MSSDSNTIRLNLFGSSYSIGEFFLFGRETFPDLPENVAERHFRIEKKGDRYLLRDLRSIHGTYLNGVPVLEAYLQPGDTIQVGNLEIQVEALIQTPPAQDLPELRSRNEKWNEQLQQLPKLSGTNFPILLLGPSGAGKEVLADTIHRLSCRRNGPLIKVNCSALSETLIESELFGHLKGSFTGAITDRKGAFEAARGGTLFLDEIGDLPYSLQAKLLRALENNEIRPVGSDRTIKTNVRIIAATHKDLPTKIQTGEFRMDLFYRLNVIQIRIPALKDRMEDFEEILFHFCRQYRVRLSSGAITLLKNQSWPGNIRELKNLIARCSVIYGSQKIEATQVIKLLPEWEQEVSLVNVSTEPNSHQESTPSFPTHLIREFEKQIILRRLAANHGNQRKTARELGIPKSTLNDKVRSYGVDPKELKKNGIPSITLPS